MRGGARSGRALLLLDLADGAVIEADLLVAADSRFSAIRDQLGIGADVRPVGRRCLSVGITRPASGRLPNTALHHTLAMLLRGCRQSSP